MNGVQIDDVRTSGLQINEAFVQNHRLACSNEDGTPSLHTNATLRYDEWKHYDTAVNKAAMQRLTIVADLMSRGLVYDLGADGMGTMVLQYEDQSLMSAAQVSMDGLTKGNDDRLEYSVKLLPLPLIHKDFSINARILASSRKNNTPLDVAQAEMAARMVSETNEDMTINGYSSYSFGGGIIYGLTDVPTRNTGYLTAGWDTLGSAGGATGLSIVDDVLAMKQANINARHYGPYGVYIPTAYETPLGEDYKQFGTVSIRERILEIENIEYVHVVDKMGANQVVAVQLTSDTIRLVQGLPVTTVEWQTEGNFSYKFKVFSIIVPHVRADQNSRSGVSHFIKP